jgi:hypothetical protein
MDELKIHFFSFQGQEKTRKRFREKSISCFFLYKNGQNKRKRKVKEGTLNVRREEVMYDLTQRLTGLRSFVDDFSLSLYFGPTNNGLHLL